MKHVLPGYAGLIREIHTVVTDVHGNITAVPARLEKHLSWTGSTYQDSAADPQRTCHALQTQPASQRGDVGKVCPCHCQRLRNRLICCSRRKYPGQACSRLICIPYACIDLLGSPVLSHCHCHYGRTASLWCQTNERPHAAVAVAPALCYPRHCCASKPTGKCAIIWQGPCHTDCDRSSPQHASKRWDHREDLYAV